MQKLSALCLILANGTLVVLLAARLDHPLLWQDEGEVAMYASRILAFGYPKVHDGRNVVYEFGPNLAVGVKESVDAYIGRTWGDFYFAVPGAWWARGVDDPYARTWRLRLPFALAGLAGLGVLLWGALPFVPAGRRTGFAAAFAGLCCVSISLQLHLRELRYYPLLVLVLGAMLALHGRLVHGRAGARAVALQSLLSLALFQVFYVAWFATTALLVADALATRVVGDGLAARRARLRRLAPHVLGALAALPALWFFETFQVASAFASDLGVSARGYLANLAWVAGHLLRHEQLLPALGARLLWIAARRRGAAPVPAAAIAARLWLFSAGYAALGCLNPLVYERYFVVLGPLLSLAFLLDASALLERAPRLLPQPAPARARRSLAAALALLALAPLALRAPALRGRLAELATPVRGPIDFAVEELRARYPDPASLVIATSYEAHPLMYYLGSRVIVGLALNNIAAERALVPDVVIPRRAWRRPLPELRRFLARGGYREERLPVLDTHYNENPSLTPSAATPDTHRFETPAVAPGTPGALRLFLREDASR